MNIDFKNVKLYPLNIKAGQIYRAIGHINLYNTNAEFVGTIMVDVPKCRYEEIDQMLFALEQVAKEVDDG